MITKLGSRVGILIVALSACGQSEDRRTQDTAAAPEPPAEAETPTVAEIAGVQSQPLAEFVIHGVCPFACCRYGKSTMISPGTLRAWPSLSADSVFRVEESMRVQSDSGLMILNPPGIGVVAGEFSTAAGGPNPGDTVEVLSYTGEGVNRVRWQGRVLELGGAVQIRMVREPVQSWWVYMTESTSQQSGWMRMSGQQAVVRRQGDTSGCR